MKASVETWKPNRVPDAGFVTPDKSRSFISTVISAGINYGGVLAFVEMAAVVIGFDASSRFVGVRVEGIEMGADMLDWGDILDH
jgi:hypothetical protein